MATIKLSEINPNEVEIEAPKTTIALNEVRPHEIEIEQEVRPRRSLSMVESGISGLSQGLTFGFADEIGAGLRAAAGKLGGDGDFKDLYKKYRDEQRAYVDAAKEDNPLAFNAGSVGGVVGSAFVPGLAALAPVKGATTAANIGRAATGGALTAAGLSDKDVTKGPEDAKGFARELAGGAIVGGVTQGALSKLGDFFGSLKPEKLKGFAEERAVKAAGAMKKDFNQLQQSGQLHKLGRDLLDKKVVTLFGSLDDVAKNSGELKSQSGKEIGKILGQADDLVTQAENMIDEGKLFGFLPGKENIGPVGAAGAAVPTKDQVKSFLRDSFQFNMNNVANRIRTEIIKPNSANPLVRGEMSKLADIAEDFSKVPSISLKQANMMKAIQGRLTKFDSDTVPQAFKKEVYNIIKDEIDNAVGKIANLEDVIASSPNTIEQILSARLPSLDAASRGSIISAAYEAAKRQYGAAKTVEKMALNRLGATRSNRGVSLTDTIAASGGFAGGGIAGAAALGALNNFGRKYGASLQAIGADKLADILSRAPNKLGQFGDVIAKAAQESPIALITAHRALMKNPDYKNILMNFEPEQRGLRLPEQRGMRLPK